jgi:glycosyltransferase involved in cell wall biosynthesis
MDVLKKMKILFLTKYDESGPSSRVRSYQFKLYLENDHVEFYFSPLHDTGYIKNLYLRNTRNYLSILKSCMNRFFFLLKNDRVRKFDLLVIEKELFPYVPFLDNWILRYLGIPYVLDYDDAIFHNYDLNKNHCLKLLLGNKISTLMLNSSLVLAGNSYLKDYAINAGAKKVTLLPSLINLDDYDRKAHYSNEGKFILGWVGSPSTQHYLPMLAPVLKKLSKIFDIELVTIGAHEFIMEGVKVICYPWTCEIQKEKIKDFDLGIMPLKDTPWEKGKCAYKLLQYMAAGVPVLASAVGANNDVVREGVNGYLASNEEDWEEKLLLCLQNRVSLMTLGENAYEIVKEHYSYQSKGDFFVKTLLSICL